MKSKKTTYLILLLAVVVLAAGIWAGYFISKKNSGLLKAKPSYAAVYLQTGDVYYGEIHWWPKLHLTKVWYPQVDAQGQTQLLPYKGLAWGPSDKLYLNPDQVVGWSYLRSDSELIPAFEKAGQ
jgi:hypothetical protein